MLHTAEIQRKVKKFKCTVLAEWWRITKIIDSVFNANAIFVDCIWYSLFSGIIRAADDFNVKCWKIISLLMSSQYLYSVSNNMCKGQDLSFTIFKYIYFIFHLIIYCCIIANIYLGCWCLVRGLHIFRVQRSPGICSGQLRLKVRTKEYSSM